MQRVCNRLPFRDCNAVQFCGSDDVVWGQLFGVTLRMEFAVPPWQHEMRSQLRRQLKECKEISGKRHASQLLRIGVLKSQVEKLKARNVQQAQR